MQPEPPIEDRTNASVHNHRSSIERPGRLFTSTPNVKKTWGQRARIIGNTVYVNNRVTKKYSNGNVHDQ